MITKICKQCGVEKPLNEFHEYNRNKDGHKGICAQCYNWNHRSEDSKREEIEKIRLRDAGLKYCPSCKTIKPISDFAENKLRKDGLRAYCKLCDKEKGLCYVRREDIKERRKIKESQKEFLDKLYEYRRNSDAYKKYIAEYRTTEQYRISQRNNNRKQNRKIQHSISLKIWFALKAQNLKKDKDYNEYLGCSLDFFKTYISSLFKEGMSWDNWGRGKGMWHLDHIIPCAYFDLSDVEQQKQCFHYTNQSPLWESDSLRKNSKYNGKRYYHKK